MEPSEVDNDDIVGYRFLRLSQATDFVLSDYCNSISFYSICCGWKDCSFELEPIVTSIQLLHEKWPPFRRRYFQMHFRENFFYVFWFKFHWSLLLRLQMTITPRLDNGLAPNRRRAIIWTNANLIHWRIYAALGGAELSSTSISDQ